VRRIFEGLVEAGLITKVEFQGHTYLVRRFARGRRRHKVLSLSAPLLGVGPRLALFLHTVMVGLKAPQRPISTDQALP